MDDGRWTSRRQLVSRLGAGVLATAGLPSLAGCATESSFVQPPDTVDTMTTQALPGTLVPDGSAEWGVLYATDKTIVRDELMRETTNASVREFIRTTRYPANSLVVVQTKHYPRSELTLASIEPSDNRLSVKLSVSGGGFALSTPITLLVRLESVPLIPPITLDLQMQRAWTTKLQTVTITVPENHTIHVCIDDPRTDEKEC